jgi:hypothetical protein
MILPYEYRGYAVEGFYDEPQLDATCTFSAYIEAPSDESCQQVISGAKTWAEAKAQAEKAIDELIAYPTHAIAKLSPRAPSHPPHDPLKPRKHL